MKIVNKLVIFLVTLMVFINIVTYIVDISFMKDFIGTMNSMEVYIIMFLVVLSVASSALIDDRAIVMSNLFVASSFFFLATAFFNFATGNNVIPSSSSLRLLIDPFIDFNIKYEDTFSFLFSISLIGLIFTGLFSIIEQPDIKNSVSKKIKFIAKSALYINIIIFIIGMIVIPFNIDITKIIFNKFFYSFSEIIIYSALLINVANYAFDVEVVPDSEFVHKNFVMPSKTYNLNPSISSNLNGVSSLNNNQPIKRVINNSNVQINRQDVGVQLFGASLNKIEDKPITYAPPVVNIPNVAVNIDKPNTPSVAVNVEKPVVNNANIPTASNINPSISEPSIPMMSSPIVRENNLPFTNNNSNISSGEQKQNTNNIFNI